MPKRPSRDIAEAIKKTPPATVFDTYNKATHYATHRMRSYRGAFDLLEQVNRMFQDRFPLR